MLVMRTCPPWMIPQCKPLVCCAHSTYSKDQRFSRLLGMTAAAECHCPLPSPTAIAHCHCHCPLPLPTATAHCHCPLPLLFATTLRLSLLYTHSLPVQVKHGRTSHLVDLFKGSSALLHDRHREHWTGHCIAAKGPQRGAVYLLRHSIMYLCNTTAQP